MRIIVLAFLILSFAGCTQYKDVVYIKAGTANPDSVARAQWDADIARYNEEHSRAYTLYPDSSRIYTKRP